MNRAQLSTTPTLTETYATMMYGTHRAEIAETIALIESYYDRPWIMSESTGRRASAAAERVPRYCFERSYVEGVLGLKAPIVESGVWPRDFEKRIIQEQLLMEGFFGDLMAAGKEKLMSTAEGVKKFGKEAWSVLQGFYLAVKEGQTGSLATSIWKKSIRPIFAPLMKAFEWMVAKFPGWGLDKLAIGAQKGLGLLNSIQGKLKSIKGWKAVTLFSGVAIGVTWLWNKIGDWIEELQEKVGGDFKAAMNEQADPTTSQKAAAAAVDVGSEALVDWIKESGKEMITQLIGPELMEKISKLAAEVTVSGWWKAAKAAGKGAKLVVDAIGSATERFVSRQTAKVENMPSEEQNESYNRGTMKITKRQLRRIIKEEKTRIIKEMRPGVGDDELIDGVHDGALMDLEDHNKLEMVIDSTINGFVQMGYSREDVVYALKVFVRDLK